MEIKKDKINKEEVIKIEEKVKKDKVKQERAMKVFVFLILAGIVAVSFWAILGSTAGKIEYRGVEFRVVEEIAPYKTSFEITENNLITGAATQIIANFYLRGNPLETAKIPFDGELVLMKRLVLNSSDPFQCNGTGILGVTNLARLYQSIGAEVTKDENATCDPQGRYTYMHLQNSSRTGIEQVGEACYIMHINNCEILPVTERFMLETFVKINELEAN